jgi:hypothetical protein
MASLQPQQPPLPPNPQPLRQTSSPAWLDDKTLILIHSAVIAVAVVWVLGFGSSVSDNVRYFTLPTVAIALTMFAVHSIILNYLAYNPGHPQENTIRHLSVVWLLLVCLGIYVRKE